MSDAVRKQAQVTIEAVSAKREAETSMRYARRVAQADEFTDERRVIHCVDAIVDKVRREPGEWTRGKLRMWVGIGRRDVFGEAFDKAAAAGRVLERSEPGQGSDRVRLYPGESGP